MIKYFFLILGLLIVPVLYSVVVFDKYQSISGDESKILSPATSDVYYSPILLGASVFREEFSSSQNLEEAGKMSNSKSSMWWVNSGAYLINNNGIGKTLQGNLSYIDPWHVAYAISNPVDTENGNKPQNIFRLVTRTKWKNLSQELYFKINKINKSSSPQRNASNGVFLFNRYLDGSNIYYTGIRVDGAVVIKKKLKGTYYTLAYKQYFNGKYNINSNINLIPTNKWLGIKSEVVTIDSDNVSIKVYIKESKSDAWKLALETTDTKGKNGNSLIDTEGFAGIRTDFMDVEFDNYQIESK